MRIKEILVEEKAKKSTLDALIKYRLTALVTYRLLESIDKVNQKTFLEYQQKYSKNIYKSYWGNRLRSLKLNFNILKLEIKVKSYF